MASIAVVLAVSKKADLVRFTEVVDIADPTKASPQGWRQNLVVPPIPLAGRTMQDASATCFPQADVEIA